MTTNPLLSKIQLPGETFQLPSQGIFYVNEELAPDVVNGEVEIYPMNTYCEILLNSPDKLLSGKAITQVFEICVPQVLKPMQLLAKDLDFILCCLRYTTFGNTMDIDFIHTCEQAKSHSYSINLQNIIKSTQKFDPTSIETEYSVKLPNGQNVLIKPMIYKDVLQFYDMTASQKTNTKTDEELEQMLLDMMTSLIQSVDNITDPNLIFEWLKQLNLGWKKLIEKSITNVTEWGVNYNTVHTCKDCGEEMTITITANPIDFFFQQ